MVLWRIPFTFLILILYIMASVWAARGGISPVLMFLCLWLFSGAWMAFRHKVPLGNAVKLIPSWLFAIWFDRVMKWVWR